MAPESASEALERAWKWGQESPLPGPDESVPLPPGTELPDVLLWVFSGGGAGVLAYWVIGKTRRPDWSAAETRAYALALTGLLAGGAYCVAVILGYEPRPGEAQGWIEELFSVCFVALLTSQAIHGWRDLR